MNPATLFPPLEEWDGHGPRHLYDL